MSSRRFSKFNALLGFVIILCLMPFLTGFAELVAVFASEKSGEEPTQDRIKIDPDILDAFWGKQKKTSRIFRIESGRSSRSTFLETPRHEKAPAVVLMPHGLGKIVVEELPQYSLLFQNNKGWIGGDGDYSVLLSNNTTMWLFGDSFIGEIREGKRAKDSIIVNNSIAIQRGNDPSTAQLEFFCGRTEKGDLSAFITPEDDRGWFWIYDGVRTKKGIYLFLIQIDRDDKSAFGFKAIGTSLGHIANSDDPPEQWRVAQKKIPWGSFSTGEDAFLGSAVVRDGKYIYIYGIKEKKEADLLNKYMIVARAPEEAVEDFTKWRFYAGGSWHEDFKEAERLCGGLANEFSVSFQPSIGKFVAVYSDYGFSGNISLRIAPTPWGPWSEAVTIYKCPETTISKNILLYAAKAHKSVSTKPDELIVSYISNSLDFNDLLNDASFYFPRFINLKFYPE